jgi:hypothetical protein
MGGDERDDNFTPGGGTFRDPLTEPKAVHPLLTEGMGQHPAQYLGDMYGRNLLEDPKKIYDMEALRRLLELLNQDRAQKPHGVPEGGRIGF